MNKQEKNIEDVIIIPDKSDIDDFYFDHFLDNPETVAVIAEKSIIEYLMYEALDLFAAVSIRKVDLELDEDNAEYMMTLDDDCNMVVCPIEFYDDDYFTDIGYAYVSMDGDISQMTINHLLDRDVKIVLFGNDCDEKCDDDDDNGKLDSYSETHTISRSDDGTPEGFTKSWATNKYGCGVYSSYSFFSDNLDLLRNIANEFGIKI